MPLLKFLDLKLELMFKKIFGIEKNKKIFIYVLNDILGSTDISAIMDPEIASDKQSIVDILCEGITEARYVIEMQFARDKGFEKLAQFYAAKSYSRQLGKFGNYIDLKKFFFIAIFNGDFLPEEVNYISTHSTRDIKINGHCLESFQLVFIELPKFSKNKVKQLINIVKFWYFFFKNVKDVTEIDLKKIDEKALIIKLVYDELDKFR